MENKHNTSDETVNSSLEYFYADSSKVEIQNSKTCYFRRNGPGKNIKVARLLGNALNDVEHVGFT